MERDKSRSMCSRHFLSRSIPQLSFYQLYANVLFAIINNQHEKTF